MYTHKRDDDCYIRTLCSHERDTNNTVVFKVGYLSGLLHSLTLPFVLTSWLSLSPYRLPLHGGPVPPSLSLTVTCLSITLVLCMRFPLPHSHPVLSYPVLLSYSSLSFLPSSTYTSPSLMPHFFSFLLLPHIITLLHSLLSPPPHAYFPLHFLHLYYPIYIFLLSLIFPYTSSSPSRPYIRPRLQPLIPPSL